MIQFCCKPNNRLFVWFMVMRGVVTTVDVEQMEVLLTYYEVLKHFLLTPFNIAI